MCSTSSLEPVRASRDEEMRPRARRGLSVPLQTGSDEDEDGISSPLWLTSAIAETSAPAHGSNAKLPSLETVAELDEVALHVADEVLEDGAQLDDGGEVGVERVGLGLGLPLAVDGGTLLLGGRLLLGLL